MNSMIIPFTDLDKLLSVLTTLGDPDRPISYNVSEIKVITGETEWIVIWRKDL